MSKERSVFRQVAEDLARVPACDHAAGLLRELKCQWLNAYVPDCAEPEYELDEVCGDLAFDLNARYTQLAPRLRGVLGGERIVKALRKIREATA